MGQSLAYMEYLRAFGEVILLTPYNNMAEMVNFADVLVLPGGADVDYRRYTETMPGYYQGRPNPAFEYFDTTLLPMWIASGKPIIGICRGLQTLNVALGGTLYGHVDDHESENHTIYTRIPGYFSYTVNSLHHQAIDKLAPGLEMIGWSTFTPQHKQSASALTRPLFKLNKHTDRRAWTKDEYYVLPEIIKHTGKPYIAFQYHPELIGCELATRLICETLGVTYAGVQPSTKISYDSELLYGYD
jgi:gamma-glutamyl-gamma-aminobutyrate hydrolase PuuD